MVGVDAHPGGFRASFGGIMVSQTAGTANASVRARGAATQNRILEKAVHIASVEGLAAMSLATLAKATAMSKSGLFAHFRSKEALQIAIIDEAERIFMENVVAPSKSAAPGKQRFELLVNTYVDYCARGPFEGGCFFAAAAHEFDGRPGPVRDRVAQFFTTWNAHLKAAIVEAYPSTDADLLVFEVNGVGLGVNFTAQLGLGADHARRMGKEAVRHLLARVK
jgi:AcrR family transcriptional regulator